MTSRTARIPFIRTRGTTSAAARAIAIRARTVVALTLLVGADVFFAGAARAIERVDQTIPALWNRIREAKTELEDLAVTAEPTLDDLDRRIESSRTAVVNSPTRSQAVDAWTTALELEVEKVERQMRYVKRGRGIAERIAVDARRLEKRLAADTTTPESREAVQELEGNQFQGLADATTKLYARLDLESAEVERMGNLLRTAWTSRAEDLPQIEVTAGGVKAWADSLTAEFRAKQGELVARKQLVRSLLDRAILGELDQFRTAVLDHPGADSLLGRDDPSEDSIATLANLYDYAIGQTPDGSDDMDGYENVGMSSLDYFASGDHVARRTAAASNR